MAHKGACDIPERVGGYKRGVPIPTWRENKISYRENDEVSADAAAAAADAAAERRLNHSIPRTVLRTGDTITKFRPVPSPH